MKNLHLEKKEAVKVSGIYVEDIDALIPPIEIKPIKRNAFTISRWNVGEGNDMMSVLVVEQVAHPGVRIQIEFCKGIADLKDKRRRAVGMNVVPIELIGDDTFIGLCMCNRDDEKVYTPAMAHRDSNFQNDASRWFHLYGAKAIKE